MWPRLYRTKYEAHFTDSMRKRWQDKIHLFGKLLEKKVICSGPPVHIYGAQFNTKIKMKKMTERIVFTQFGKKIMNLHIKLEKCILAVSDFASIFVLQTS